MDSPARGVLEYPLPRNTMKERDNYIKAGHAQSMSRRLLEDLTCTCVATRRYRSIFLQT